jgi:serine/threonine protein kinase
MNNDYFPQDFRPPVETIEVPPYRAFRSGILSAGKIGFLVGAIIGILPGIGNDNNPVLVAIVLGLMFGVTFGIICIIIRAIYIHKRGMDYSIMGIVTYLCAANTSSKDSTFYLQITDTNWNFLKDKKGVSGFGIKMSQRSGGLFDKMFKKASINVESQNNIVQKSLPAVKVSFSSDIVEGPPLKEGSKITLKGRLWYGKSKPVEAKQIWNLSPKGDTDNPVVVPNKTPGIFPSELSSNYSGIEQIGEGGFAQVFKATRKKDNIIVAVKIPKLDEKTGRMFLNEVSAWRTLNHENIVKLLDANVHPAAYLETEYIDGIEIKGKPIRDLSKYPKPVEEELAIRLIRMTAEGLHHAHTKGVIHRDLKPSNVLINSSLRPKITDFGVAKLSVDTGYTMFRGYTLQYAAPEQIDSAAYGRPDKRTDIYQLGVIFYELLTCKLPYEGSTDSEVSTKIITPAILPIKPSVRNPIFKKYDSIVMKCLEKKKEDRFKDTGEFLEQLKNVTRNDSSVEQLKTKLYEQENSQKIKTSSEEILKSRRMSVEILGKLLVIYAESDNKTELLKYLEDMKSYTIKNLDDISKAIEHLEFLRKNGSRVSEDFISLIDNLVHKIRRENE